MRRRRRRMMRRAEVQHDSGMPLVLSLFVSVLTRHRCSASVVVAIAVPKSLWLGFAVVMHKIADRTDRSQIALRTHLIHPKTRRHASGTCLITPPRGEAFRLAGCPPTTRIQSHDVDVSCMFPSDGNVLCDVRSKVSIPGRAGRIDRGGVGTFNILGLPYGGGLFGPPPLFLSLYLNFSSIDAIHTPEKTLQDNSNSNGARLHPSVSHLAFLPPSHKLIYSTAMYITLSPPQLS